MGAVVRYLSHPQVRIDPDVPVPEWGLSDQGAARVAAFAASGILAGTSCVISSTETKAMETARPLAVSLGVTCRVLPDMHENDRSATGYLPRTEFEATADAFFANPDQRIRGWETAVRAQARICRAVNAALVQAPAGDVLIVGHGGVGTLLMCHIGGLGIDRCHDQPDGGGNVFAFSREPTELLAGWASMEALAGMS